MHPSPNFASLLSAVWLVHAVGAAVVPQIAPKVPLVSGARAGLPLDLPAPPVEKREPHYIEVPVHAHHHKHGVSVFVGHHHEHHHPKTVIVTRNPKDKDMPIDINADASINILPVRVADVSAKVTLPPIDADVRTRLGETSGQSHKRVSYSLICHILWLTLPARAQRPPRLRRA